MLPRLLLQLVDEAESYAGFWQRTLQAIVAGGQVEQAAVLAADRGIWRAIAAWPRGQHDPPSDLAADAMVEERVVSSGPWRGVAVSADSALLIRGGSEAWLREHAPSLGSAAHSVARWEAAECTAKRFGRLVEINRAWAAATGTRPLLEAIAEAACELFDADRASIFLWDEANRTLVGQPAIGFAAAELRLPDDKGVVGAVLQSGKPMRTGPDSSAAVDRSLDQKTGYQTQTLLCVPMDAADGRRLGVFELLNKRGGAFTDEDEAGLTGLAANAAIALANTQQFEALLARHDQLVDQAASGARLLGGCSAIESIRGTIERVADTDLAILILGENGTGKEVAAQALHYRSRRRGGPFVAVNCAAITETLLESELFGHEKGAFTDARETRPGKFEAASGGTLLLDEIGDMSLGGQAKLLRVLEEKVVVRVGGSAPIATDVRLLAATNQNLAQLVREKRFREDLFYRLNVVSIELPPLRSRGDDVLVLAEHFLRGFCQSMGRKAPKLSADAKSRLASHRWPGNVRELRNLMERVAYLHQGPRVEASDLAFVLAPGKPTSDLMDSDLPLSSATREFQRGYIRHTIEGCRGNVTDAAERLGVHRSNLYRKMTQLGMAADGDSETDDSDSPTDTDQRR
ncbi:Nitrogen fixation protein VnfA [Pirellulimonas nuda]|uniref:Nitrogen fixation protein VnfA n=1 Tax=Pirellulimonas nuda TaxID=2528009 RepID=A0A518DAZ6_9BACT|nr:sigma-54-dependent Fis family transcriptional regulator [Pirellulimonas nuda]QDU88659.1 Nitrogen fixation protein VnfA [Pirellulimonas nuda]